MANVAPQVCSGLMQLRRVVLGFFTPLLFIVKTLESAALLLPKVGLMPSVCLWTEVGTPKQEGADLSCQI